MKFHMEGWFKNLGKKENTEDLNIKNKNKGNQNFGSGPQTIGNNNNITTSIQKPRSKVEELRDRKYELRIEKKETKRKYEEDLSLLKSKIEECKDCFIISAQNNNGTYTITGRFPEGEWNSCEFNECKIHWKEERDLTLEYKMEIQKITSEETKIDEIFS